jgi:hypothetical protein
VDYQMPFMRPSYEGHAINHNGGDTVFPHRLFGNEKYSITFDIVNSALEVIGQVQFQSMSAQRNLYNMYESEIRLHN